jgi:hypothetical protein
MAQLSKPAIPAKMYRNFAIVTIALTGCLALFANSAPNSGDAAAERPGTRASAPPRAASTPRYGQARLQTGSTVEVSDSFEASEEYSQSFKRSTSGRMNVSGVIAIGATDLPAPGSENAGFTRAYLASLTDEELDELLRQLRAGGIEDPAVRRQVMEVLETGAQRRAGRGSTLAD